MKRILLIPTLLFLTFLSCKKEKADPVVTQPVVTTPTDTSEDLLEIKTAYGNMYMWLYRETPLHRANYLNLAATGYLDSSTFHRCVPNFVIQGGDPNSKDADSTNDGTGGPGYTIPAEINVTKLKHIYGAVGAARDNNPAKASNGSQFYIVLPKAGTSSLNGNYTVFGLILGGMGVADTIVKQPQNASNRPYTDVRMDVNVIQKTRAQLRSEFNFYGY